MLNIVIIIGRLTATPEVKTTSNGTSVCSFSVAVDRSYQKNNEKQTDFINCVAWRYNAEFISKYFVKGQMIAIVGKLQEECFTDKNGKKQAKYEVNVGTVDFCGSKPNAQKILSNEAIDEFEEISMSDKDLPF